MTLLVFSFLDQISSQKKKKPASLGLLLHYFSMLSRTHFKTCGGKIRITWPKFHCSLCNSSQIRILPSWMDSRCFLSAFTSKTGWLASMTFILMLFAETSVTSKIPSALLRIDGWFSVQQIP